MKKAAIITIYSRLNYGNRLQNYAVQELLKGIDIEPLTIKNVSKFGAFRKKIDSDFKIGEQITTKNDLYQLKRNRFIEFNEEYLNLYEEDPNINNIEFNRKLKNYFDYFIVGSDQVWNYNIKSLSELNFLPNIESDNKIAFSASLSVDSIPKEFESYYKEYLSKFKAISVREEKAKEILERLLERKIDIVIDPILMLKKEEWEKIMKSPKEKINKKYILVYMISNEKPSIKNIESNIEIVDINSINSEYFLTDPSEFIYLLKNAEYIVTDSYHAAILSIIYNKRCRLYKRNNNYIGMNCRVDTIRNILLEDNSNFEETEKYLDFIYKSNIYQNNKIKKEIENGKKFLKKYVR